MERHNDDNNNNNLEPEFPEPAKKSLIWEKTPRPPGKKTTELWANNYKHVAARSVYSPEPKKRPVDIIKFSKIHVGGYFVTR